MSIISSYTFANDTLDSILDDLSVRFIINCPPEELASVEVNVLSMYLYLMILFQKGLMIVFLASMFSSRRGALVLRGFYSRAESSASITIASNIFCPHLCALSATS